MLVKVKDFPTSAGLAGNLTIQGKIIRVYEKKAGQGDYGPWSFQNVTIEDDSGQGTICLKNRDDELTTADVDRSITIQSQETKNGVLGVKIEQEEYKDKQGQAQTVIKAIITKAARITFGDTNVTESATPTQETHKESLPLSVSSLAELRAETILSSVKTWREALKPELDDVSNPAYPQIISALITAAGRNADTLFLSITKQSLKNGG